MGGFGYDIVQHKTALAQTSESFGGNIVLGRPTDRSITVNVLFTANQDSVYLEYGERGRSLNGTANNMTIWSATMRKRYLPNPQPDDFYSGNAKPEPFVGLLQDDYAGSGATRCS